MKTFNECKAIVAKKYGLGKTLVTGHLAKYWEEAAELYLQSNKQQSSKK